MVEMSYHGFECRMFLDRKLVYRKLIDMALQKHQITEPVWRVRLAAWRATAGDPAGNTCETPLYRETSDVFLKLIFNLSSYHLYLIKAEIDTNLYL